jgi:molecular chaperone HscB
MAETAKTAVAVAGNQESAGACWSCGDMRAAHFCKSCGKVQPPLPADYFTFFSLPRKLNIDSGALEREFYQLSRKLHPDLFARMDPREQEWSLQQSSLLNDAYRTLKDPIKRTEYLLKIEGVQLEEQSKAATEQARRQGGVKKQVVPPALLEEVFELNMQLEEMRMSKRTGERDLGLVKELETRKAMLETQLAALLEELKDDWSEWDKRVDQGSETERRVVRDRMVDVLNRRNYIRNLARDVNEAIEQ